MPATYEPIVTTTLGSAASTITFSSIPSTYTDLRLVLTGKCIHTSPTQGTIIARFNGDTGSNYSYTWIYGNGSAATSSTASSLTGQRLWFAADTAISNLASLATLDIFNYAGSTFKTMLHEHSNDDTTAAITVGRRVLLWRSTSAITSIELSNLSFTDYAAGTTATLYGIKSA
jgi:hypothetical protein